MRRTSHLPTRRSWAAIKRHLESRGSSGMVRAFGNFTPQGVCTGVYEINQVGDAVSSNLSRCGEFCCFSARFQESCAVRLVIS